MSLKRAFLAVAVGARGFFVSSRPARQDGHGPTLAIGLVFGGLASFAGATSAMAAPPTGYFVGSAYGTMGTVKVGPLAAGLGPTAYIPCPCRGTNGEVISNKLVGLTAGLDGKLLRARAISSSVQTTTPRTNVLAADNVSRVEGISAFNGLIMADSIQAAAHVRANENVIKTGDAGSQFVNLKVAGKAVQANVAANTRINLAGLGYVTLKRETDAGNGKTRGALTIDMIAVTITSANTFGLPIGAEVVVGHAVAGFVVADIQNTVSGRAWAGSVSATEPNLLGVSTGLIAFQAMGCNGTDGKTVSNYANSVILKPVGSVGTAVSTVYSKGAFAQTQSSVENIKLLGGLISATGVKSVATTYIAKGKRVRSTEGTQFASLKVLGITLPVNVKPNTKIGLPGIGYVLLNEQIIPAADSDDDMEVNAIHIAVTTKNVLNLPVNTKIFIGHASSGVSDAAAGS